ncbi:hypothetical protein WJX73_007933 [Symbiochloris irregularis]|uniref:Tocopherol cyclase n=1 Tax=Symbiochloris irregularis TaxID=706552 RepID=A0AAW1NSA2_9CHLO
MKFRTSSDVSAVGPVPHSAYHFDGRRGRFFEGWYFKVKLDKPGHSFALIYSIEDPNGDTPLSGTGAQIMGPDDSYLLQYAKGSKDFWADGDQLALGATFKRHPESSAGARWDKIIGKEQFDAQIEQGYQASLTWHQGSLVRAEEGAGGTLPSTVTSASWAFSVEPVLGWGDQNQKQKATAGWLAALPVFEPHWQVMMAKGLATGHITWGGQRHDFVDAPAYSEKNWGGGFPSKWFWIQCEDFQGAPRVALTAVGAKRSILGLSAVVEDVGMIGLHWNDRFLELVPWTGSVQWEVEPWGRWRIWARNEGFEALVEATCDSPGTPLRAPTPANGLQPACRDSFFGKVRVRLWNIKGYGTTADPPLLDVTGEGAAVEVGGGPWDATWKAQAQMRQPLKSLVGLPVDVEGLASLMPGPLRPKGL